LAAVAIVAIVLISAIAAVRPFQPQLGSPLGGLDSRHVIQVTGTGTVTHAPDQAILMLAVTTQASDAADATTSNAAIMAKVIGALVASGISKDSIQTTSYTLTPIYENKPDSTQPPKVVGYMARNAIQVTASDLTAVGNLLDVAVGAGANEVQGVAFTFSSNSLAAIQKQALQLAVQDADAQAKAVASALGVKITGPIAVVPGYISVPIYHERAAVATQPTPIQPGALQVTATVQVTYEFA